jgi:Kef-type K+ transport system membrane component KefB
VHPGFLASPQFQVSLLLMVALAGYIVASRIGQSAVVGEILVGLIVGPSLLGLVFYTDFVRELANFGAVVLLFVIGLEFDLKDIVKPKYMLIAALGVILPWGAGYCFSLALGFGSAESIFIGTALTATSIAITADVLKEMGKLGTPVAQAIIGSAVIDDVLGLIALSITLGVTEGSFSVIAVGILIAKTLAFLVGGGLAGYFLLRGLIEAMDAGKLAARYPETPFILSMAIAFAYAALAELIGLSSIVGAFLAGSCLGGLKLKKGKSYEEGADYLRIIFSSIFFVSLGVIADLRAMSPGILLLIAGLTLVAIASKLVGCGLPALLGGMSLRDSAAIGVGMVPRGEVAMIVALIALERGVIKQDAYVTVIIMSLITTVATPYFLKRLLEKTKKAPALDAGRGR